MPGDVAELAKAERDTLAACIQNLEAAVVTRDGELGVIVNAVPSLKDIVAAGDSQADTANSQSIMLWTR